MKGVALMFKRVKGVLLILTLAAVTVSVFIGCSFFGGGSSGKGSTVNRCYIISSKDLDAYLENMLPSNGGEKKKDSDGYTVPKVEELTIGETYYVLGYTSASTKDGSKLEFSTGEFVLRTGDENLPIEDDVLEIKDSGSFGSNGASAGVRVNEKNGSMVTFTVTPYADGSEALFVSFIEIEVKTELELDVEYRVNATIKKNTYGVANTVKASASALYPDKLEMNELKVSYLDGSNFVDGRYETSSLVESIEMKVGKEYFMVISAKVKSLIEEKTGDDGDYGYEDENEPDKTVTLTVKISPRNIADGTLEEAGAGNFSESQTDTEKTIKVTFKIPEIEEGEKQMEFIIKITPVSLGSPTVSYDFSASGVSIIGSQRKAEKTLVINGEAKCSEGFEYRLSADQSYYTVTELGEAKGSIILIPSEYNGLPVKAIADNAFKGFSKIKSIEVSEGITSIGASAFANCTGLLTVQLPSTATSVGNNALLGCNSITALTVNLGGKQLKSLFGASTLPASLKTVTLVGDTTLCANAFAGGTKIEKLSLPATLTTVDMTALNACSSLYELSLDSANQSLILLSGILYDKATTEVLGHVGKFVGEMTYPTGLTEIPGGDMSGVTKITVPITVTRFYSSVKNLAPMHANGSLFLFKEISTANLQTAILTTGETAPSFSGATKLTSLKLPDTVTSIPTNVFSGCESLKSVTLPSGITVIPYGAFNGCKSLTSVNIPSGVTTIGATAFKGCESLASINIPSIVTSIGKNAFTDCKKITSVTLPAIGTVFPDGLFYGCESLTSVNIPNGILYINENAFNGCKSLASITIPDTVTHIYSNAFTASGLKSVKLPTGISYIGSRAFANCTSLAKFELADGNANYCVYGGILYDADKTEIVQVPAGISGKVTVASTVAVIRTSDFSGCVKMTEIVLPGGIDYVEPGAFTSCKALTAITGVGKSCFTFKADGTNMGQKSWKSPSELVTLMNKTYPNLYFFGNPKR